MNSTEPNPLCELIKNSPLLNNRPKDIAQMYKFYEDQKNAKLDGSSGELGEQDNAGDQTIIKSANQQVTGKPYLNNNQEIFKDTINEQLKMRLNANHNTYLASGNLVPSKSYTDILTQKPNMDKYKELYKEEVYDFKPKINKNSKYIKNRPGNISQMYSHYESSKI